MLYGHSAAMADIVHCASDIAAFHDADSSKSPKIFSLKASSGKYDDIFVVLNGFC